MRTPKPAGRRRGLLVAAVVAFVLLVALWLVASSLVSAPRREHASRPPDMSAELPAPKPAGEPPGEGSLPPAAGGDGPREPASPLPETSDGASPEPPPAVLPAPAEQPPVPAEGGFADNDHGMGSGGGGMAPPVAGEKQPDAGAPASGPVVRHPYLDAPETIQPGERVAVTVALTLDPLTPGVTAKAAPGGKLTAEGALELPLPADAESWPIDVDLIAPGFDAADGEPLQRRIVLYRDNDSDFARFDLTLRSDAVAGTTRRLAARFYHAGRFLGSAARPVVVAGNGQPAQPSALSSSGPMAQGEAIDLDIGGSVPDMDVLVQFDDPARPRHAAVYIHSPHIAGAIVGSFDLPDDAVGWIEANYAQLVTLGSRLRSASSLTAAADGDPAAQRKRIVAFAEGFGDQLYRRYTPREFRQVFVQLRAEKRLSSLLVSSNSPAFPWELVFAPGGDGEPGGFLGITYRIGRWTPRDDGGLSDRPGGEIVFNGVAAVAPHYEGRQALPFQQREINALSALSGFDAIGGDYAAFEALVRDPVGRFVHFSGHGAIGDPLAGEAPFAILLEDERVDPTTWRRIAGAADPARRPFYFFNACDSGAAKVMGGFVQGWGATVLESGAGGFIGGMWPLSDETAATFAAEYYARLVGGLAADRVRIADVLREVRRGFYATGDPTYLAYTFYGDPNLTVIRQQP